MDLETTSMNRGMFRGAVVCSRVPNSNWLKESRRWIDSYTGNSVQARSRVGVGHGWRNGSTFALRGWFLSTSLSLYQWIKERIQQMHRVIDRRSPHSPLKCIWERSYLGFAQPSDFQISLLWGWARSLVYASFSDSMRLQSPQNYFSVLLQSIWVGFNSMQPEPLTRINNTALISQIYVLIIFNKPDSVLDIDVNNSQQDNFQTHWLGSLWEESFPLTFHISKKIKWSNRAFLKGPNISSADGTTSSGIEVSLCPIMSKWKIKEI